MKRRQKLILSVLLFGLALGAFNPLLIWGASEPGAINPWDFAIDPPPYWWGFPLTGPFSIYYLVDYASSCGDGSSYLTTMFYSVGFTFKNKDNVFTGSSDAVCLADLVTQAGIIKNFLGTSLQSLFPKYKIKNWKLKAINNGFYNFPNDGYFVADVEVVVR
jgi:hypothetical protein